jgi:TetR/AcrR family transcriptional regulator
MPDEPVERIIDAAYVCFTRHGVRRTTMDDIAAAAEMSRPAVYQYVRNKDDVFRRLATRLFDSSMAVVFTAARDDGPLAKRMHDMLSAKLELTLRLYQDSPHAAELLDTGARLSGDLVEQFTITIRDVLSSAISTAERRGEIALRGTDAAEIAEIGIALTYGLEADMADPDRSRHRLRLGIDLLVAGLAPTRNDRSDPAPNP